MLIRTKFNGINSNVEVNSLPVLQSTILPQKVIAKIKYTTTETVIIQVKIHD